MFSLNMSILVIHFQFKLIDFFFSTNWLVLKPLVDDLASFLRGVCQ